MVLKGAPLIESQWDEVGTGLCIPKSGWKKGIFECVPEYGITIGKNLRWTVQASVKTFEKQLFGV